MLIELTRGADWWEFQASPTSLDADTVTLEWSSRQKFRGVGPRRPARRSVRDGPGRTARGGRGANPAGATEVEMSQMGAASAFADEWSPRLPPPTQRDLHHGIERGR